MRSDSGRKVAKKKKSVSDSFGETLLRFLSVILWRHFETCANFSAKSRSFFALLRRRIFEILLHAFSILFGTGLKFARILARKLWQNLEVFHIFVAKEFFLADFFLWRIFFWRSFFGRFFLATFFRQIFFGEFF